MIYDTIGRLHDYLRISVTENCNFNCFYCKPDDIKSQRNIEMTAEEIYSLAEIFTGLGIKKIRLTGGEPLIRKDIARIILQLSELPAELSITTNGFFIDRHIDILKKSSIKSLNISLDSLKPARFWSITQKNVLQRIYKNIFLLLENGFHVKVNMVVVRGVNDGEIMNFVRLTKKFPLYIRFIEFMPFEGNRWNDSYVIKQNEILEKISSHYSIEKIYSRKNDTAKKFRVKNFSGTFAVITTVSEPFCSDCNRIRLSSSGKTRNCLFSPEETDLLTALRNGKDIRPLIHDCISKKFPAQGGLTSLREITGLKMSAIGG